MCLAPGSAGAPGEHARGEVVALVLKQSPAVLTLLANPFCGETLRQFCFIVNSHPVAEF